jgi:hypothetical protein
MAHHKYPYQEKGSNTIVKEDDVYSADLSDAKKVTHGPTKPVKVGPRRKRDESQDTDFGVYLYEDLKQAKAGRIERTIDVPSDRHAVKVGNTILLFKNEVKEEPTLWQIAQQFRTKLSSMSKSKVKSVKDYLADKLDDLSARLRRNPDSIQ